MSEESCETSCESCTEAEAFPLYDLFPLIIRYRDAMAQGDVNATGNLEKITYALEKEASVTACEIAHLADLLDVDSCDPAFLLFLSATLGTMAGAESGVSEHEQRWFIKNLVSFYKIKGTLFSWYKRYRYFHRAGVLDFWYRAWELWKTIPYEVGDWSRYLDYTHRLRAARFDLYYLDEDGKEVFLRPSEAEPFVPYIESTRPIHVLLRRYVNHIELEDGVARPTDEFSVAVDISPPPSPCATSCEAACEEGCEVEVEIPDLGYVDLIPQEIDDEFEFDSECISACETGGCQGWCETTCEAHPCEILCQVACEFTSEIAPCDLDCKSSCEAGSCEAGCQVGSCQSGCQSCNETEVFPAHIDNVTGPGDILEARIWFRSPSSDFYPVDTSDPWWINPAGESKQIQYEAVGDGVFDAGGGNATYIPALKVCDWITVRCVKPAEFSEEHTVKGNSSNKLWTGDLGHQPHPCSVRVEALLEAAEVLLTGAGVEGTVVVFVTSTVSFNVGDEVQIRDEQHAETNSVVAILTGTSLLVRCPLRFTYSPGVLGKVIRPLWKAVVHTEEMLAPVDATHWYGKFGGDVDEDAPASENRVNHRGTYDLKVTFRDPPPNGATITVYYVQEGGYLTGCKYSWVQTPQAIDDTTLEFDGNRKLTAIGGEDKHFDWIETDVLGPSGPVETLDFRSLVTVTRGLEVSYVYAAAPDKADVKIALPGGANDNDVLTWDAVAGTYGPEPPGGAPHDLLNGGVHPDTEDYDGAGEPAAGDIIVAHADNKWYHLSVGDSQDVLAIPDGGGLPYWEETTECT